MLNYSKESNIEITEEVSQKFGKSKILVSYTDTGSLEAHKDLLKEYVSELICLDKNQVKNNTGIPTICSLEKATQEEAKEILLTDHVSGLTGNVINDTIEDTFSQKISLAKEGVLVSACEAAMKWSDFKLNSDQMLPVIVQDYKTNEVLMMAYMNEEHITLRLLLVK